MEFNYVELSAEDEEIVQSLPLREISNPVWADVFHQIYTAPNGALTVTGRDYGGAVGVPTPGCPQERQTKKSSKNTIK